MTPASIHCLLHSHKWKDEPDHARDPEEVTGITLECTHCGMECSDSDVIKQYLREQTEQEIEL